MPFRQFQGPIAAAAIVALAVAGAWEAGGPLGAVLLGLIGGSTATLIAWRAHFFPENVVAAVAPSEGPERWAEEILSALPEPILLIDDGKVVVANSSARQLLGQWIQGQDVRLALRHPATVERLSRPAPSDQPV
ncbi:MAG TPA: PAS domain-containing protein, partial [Allosphingosinicella sp.]|nr:PAS domain-containing protein [Allosphingosinicella sp.]